MASGGTVSWAEPPLAAPNYIFPINSCCFSVANLSDFQELMYRPLYWFGTGSQPTLNAAESLAYPPSYQGTTVVVNLKPGLQWSNGEPVDAADVVFYMNMLKTVAHADWGAYAPGYFPDNVKTVVATGKEQVTFTLTSTFSSTWFTYNELSQITPFPIAWDITKTGGAPGSGACAKANFADIKVGSSKTEPIIPEGSAATACFAVFNYLANSKTGQAAAPNTYASNPLWAIVDGPWKLASIDTTTGNTDFVPNVKYKGPQKPRLAHFDEIGYQTDTAEYQALEAGTGPDVGYIPPQDIPPTTGNPLVAGANAGTLAGKYNLAITYLFQVNYFPLNLANPTVGPIFKQLYARQALQLGIDQATFIHTFDAGYGVPTVGPVPTVPPTYESKSELTNPYAFNIAKGKSLLESHGWTVSGSGPATCTKPGTAANECGAGIKSGAKFAFTLLWATGAIAFKNQVTTMASDWASEGIGVTLKGEQFSSVISTAGANCYVTGDCSWEAANWGGGWVFAPDFLPTGEEIFDGVPGCNSPTQLAVSNAGAYCDATNHANILATTKVSALSDLYKYEDYLTNQLPVLFQPLTPGLGEIKAHLEGVLPFNVFGTLNPEYWGWQTGNVSNS
jgi:peptide/nickel transport system substrate-binding protein